MFFREERTLKRSTIDTTLGQIAVRTAGDGDTILFWPSLMMTGDMWSAQAEHFSARHRVVLVDPPGHSQSQALTCPFAFDECARCAVDVLDGLSVDRAHFRRQLRGRHDQRPIHAGATQPNGRINAALVDNTACEQQPPPRIQNGFSVDHEGLLSVR
jgi:3-oxoadipate enol-lactonase